MKHLIALTLTSLMLAIVALPLAAQTQSRVIKANIPFEFNFDDKTFPAGDYSLVQPMQHLLVLRDSRGPAIAQTFSEGVESLTVSDATKLKFAYFGGHRVLTEVWQNQNSSGLRLYPTANSTNFAKHRSTEDRAAAEGSQP
jgi:hypothetical protein